VCVPNDVQESGAGKTEATKKCLEFITEVGRECPLPFAAVDAQLSRPVPHHWRGIVTPPLPRGWALKTFFEEENRPPPLAGVGQPGAGPGDQDSSGQPHPRGLRQRQDR
jgi:hypothetical protein